MNTGIFLLQKEIDEDLRIKIAVNCIKHNDVLVQKLNSLCFIIYRILERKEDVFLFLNEKEIDFFDLRNKCLNLENEFDKYRWYVSLQTAYFYICPFNVTLFENVDKIIQSYPYCMINLLRTRFLYCLIGLKNQEDVSDIIYKSIEDFKSCIAKINFELDPNCRMKEISTATTIMRMLLLLLPYFSKNNKSEKIKILDIINMGESVFFIDAAKKILNIS